MQTISWVTDPYHISNREANKTLITLLEAQKIKAVITKVGNGINKYVYYMNPTFEFNGEIQQLLDILNYNILTLNVIDIKPEEVEEIKTFAQAMVSKITGFNISMIESNIYEDYSTPGRKDLTLTPFTEDFEFSNPIYIRPSEIGDYILRSNLEPFRDAIFLTKSPLFWLAIYNLQQTDKTLLDDYEFIYKEEVIGVKGRREDSIGTLKLKLFRLLDSYTDNIQVLKVDNTTIDHILFKELASMWDIEIVYDEHPEYIYYKWKDINRDFTLNIQDAIIAIKQHSLPSIYFTGEWVQIVEPLPINRALLKYIAVRAYSELKNNYQYIPDVDVLPDLTIVLKIASLKDALLFKQQFLLRLPDISGYSYEICFNREAALLKRWKILISYEKLLPLIIPIDKRLYLVIDTKINMEDTFEIPPIEEEDYVYLKKELLSYLKDCKELNLEMMSIEELFNIAPVEGKYKTVCIVFSREQEYGYYGYYPLLILSGLVPSPYEDQNIHVMKGQIEAYNYNGTNVVILNYGFDIIEVIFEITISNPEDLVKIVSELWRKGKFLTPWGKEYYLQKNLLSRETIQTSIILTEATLEPKLAYEYLLEIS